MSILIGILLIFLGITYLSDPSFYPVLSHEVKSDLSQFQPLISICFIIFGILILYKELLKKKDDKIYVERICPNCEETYQKSYEGDICTKCDSKLEILKGFYDRHPEKK